MRSMMMVILLFPVCHRAAFTDQISKCHTIIGKRYPLNSFCFGQLPARLWCQVIGFDTEIIKIGNSLTVQFTAATYNLLCYASISQNINNKTPTFTI